MNASVAYMAYACAWIATAAAICCAIYITGDAMPICALLLPALIRITPVEENQSDYRRGLQDAWDAVNYLIIPGELPGNGKDKQAQRNGMILASNAVMDLIEGDYGELT